MPDLSYVVLPTDSWKTELQRSTLTLQELLETLGHDKTPLAASHRAAAQFPLRVPRPFIDRMEVGNPDDPLLRQVLPVRDELLSAANFVADPLSESSYNPVPGVIHKYRNRLLLIVGATCAVNCRYCFRRQFPYDENRQGKEQWQHALSYIASDENVTEVIYSGGDPLAANDSFLGWLTRSIAEISHVKRLRIHTRLPIVIPARIDSAALAWMTATRLRPVVVLHSNHANEIDATVSEMVQKLLDCRLTVLNQSVLLRGVNDSAPVLAALSEKLFEAGVLPYYLHLLDPVEGASHFDVEESVAVEILRELQVLLPGYLVPRLARDQVGAASKILLLP